MKSYQGHRGRVGQRGGSVPRSGTSSTSVQFSPAQLKDLFGGGMPDAKVKIIRQKNGLLVQAGSKDFYSERQIKTDAKGRPYIVLDSLKVFTQGRGIGTKIFMHTVQEADKYGIHTIVSRASRDDGQNGYYTLPLWGYDGDISDIDLPPKFEGVETIQQLYSLPGGMQWWKKNGETIDVTFDTRKGSMSRRILEHYASKRI